MAATDPPAGGGNFFTRKLGPFPMWVWIGIGVAALYFYESRKAAASTSSATDATTSALATQGANAAQYGYTAPDIASMLQQLQGQVSQLGGGNNGTTTTPATSPGSTGTPATTPTPAGGPSPGTAQISSAGFAQISSQAVASDLLKRGYDIVQFGTGLYYEPGQKAVPGHGQSLQWITSPALSKQLSQAGFSVVTLGQPGHLGQYYNPNQKVT
jgi:hypothetical protein